MLGQSAKDERRKEILEAAKRLLTRYGYSKMTMKDVGEEVGLNKASLYYYFPGKEDLVAHVMGEQTKDFLTAMQEKIKPAHSCPQRVTHYLLERFRFMQDVLTVYNLTLQDLRKVGPKIRGYHVDCKSQELGFFQSILDSCVEQKELAPCDTKKVAAALVNVAEGYKLQSINNPAIQPNEIVDYSVYEEDMVYTVSLILDGLKVRRG